MSPDYATWLTKQQAADAIGVSTKTIEAFAKAGQIQQAVWRPQNRGAAKAVFHPDDVARMASERKGEARAFVLPASTGSNGNGHGQHTALQVGSNLNSTPTGEDVLRLVFAAALRAISSEKGAGSQNSEKLFLTIAEAADVSGLPQADLRRAIDRGALKARQTGRGGWRIRRKDLEAL